VSHLKIRQFVNPSIRQWSTRPVIGNRDHARLAEIFCADVDPEPKRRGGREAPGAVAAGRSTCPMTWAFVDFESCAAMATPATRTVAVKMMRGLPMSIAEHTAYRRTVVVRDGNSTCTS